MKVFSYTVAWNDFVPPVVTKTVKVLKRKFDKRTWVNRRQKLPFIDPALGSGSGVDHEDLLIDLILKLKPVGFYVEVGANDPSQFPSPTTRFYNRGWTGINIEPQKGPFTGLQKLRPRDINLNICVGPERAIATFYELPDLPNGSSLNKEMVEIQKKGYHISKVKEIPMEVWPLGDVFEKYAGGNIIDFMSVDVEGYEMEVLKGNMWEKYRPKVLLIEILHYNYETITSYLESKGYKLVYNNPTNAIFIDTQAGDLNLL